LVIPVDAAQQQQLADQSQMKAPESAESKSAAEDTSSTATGVSKEDPVVEKYKEEMFAFAG
jgi:hypothetical protein